MVPYKVILVFNENPNMFINIQTKWSQISMKQLRFFRFLTARLKSKDYTPVLSLENVEHLTLRPCKEVKNLYSELIKLPKIKYGLLISKPELYLK